MRARLLDPVKKVRGAFALRTSALFRTAVAVDSVLKEIRRQLTDTVLPNSDQIRELFALPSMANAVANYVEEVREWDGDQDALPNLTSSVVAMTTLEDALLRLSGGISWANNHSGFNWWIRRRQEELQCAGFLVIPRPGSSRDFQIEPEPTLEKRLRELETIHQFGLDDPQLKKYGSIRLLTVPHLDGASPRWHPVSLGHELAHVIYSKEWIHDWIGRTRIRTAAAKEAKGVAKHDRDIIDAYSRSNLNWFSTLKSWLAETACDTVLAYFYGSDGIDALEYYLRAHSDAGDSSSHPAPELRLAALRAQAGSRLTEHRSKDPTNPLAKLLRNAYCDLAVSLRDDIWKRLTKLPSTPKDGPRIQTRDAALTSLKSGLPPQSEDWGIELIKDSPSTIECALVNAEWRTIIREGTTLYSNGQMGLRRLENRIDQAVNFLQFSHRLQLAAGDELGLAEVAKLTNVLHLSSSGVTSSTRGGESSASFDVRLGRHFIVFRRNQVPYLHSLRGGEDARKVQDLVEVGWGDDFVLHPGEMVLAVTVESFVLADDCIAQVLSRSSLGRLGLLSATAVHVQPGFKGCLTLELVNLASVPLCLTPGQRIAQIIPLKARGEAKPYTGKYQDQDWRPKFSAVQEDPESSVLRRMRV